jgi:hypothetical protein
MDNIIFLYIVIIFLILKFIVKNVETIWFLLIAIILSYFFLNKTNIIKIIDNFYEDSLNNDNINNQNKKPSIMLNTNFENLLKLIENYDKSQTYLIKYNLNSFINTYKNIKNNKIDKNIGLNDLYFLKNKVLNYIDQFNIKIQDANINLVYENIESILNNYIKSLSITNNNIQPFNSFND